MNNEHVGQNIQTLRSERNMTQEELAKSVHVPLDYIIEAETGSETLSVELLMEMCHTLDTTPNDILAGEYPSVSPHANTASLTTAHKGIQPGKEAQISRLALAEHFLYFAWNQELKP